ncbi:MAG: pilus assembly protein TadG-related protein [Pirellulaceae bacterium]|nr:pilus assembly protein TadG-related protein [Pirellulaceae bacterium]
MKKIQKKRRQGYTLVFIALLLSVLLGLAGLVIDLGINRFEARRMQSAADTYALETLRAGVTNSTTALAMAEVAAGSRSYTLEPNTDPSIPLGEGPSLFFHDPSNPNVPTLDPGAMITIREETEDRPHLTAEYADTSADVSITVKTPWIFSRGNFSFKPTKQTLENTLESTAVAVPILSTGPTILSPDGANNDIPGTLPIAIYDTFAKALDETQLYDPKDSESPPGWMDISVDTSGMLEIGGVVDAGVAWHAEGESESCFLGQGPIDGVEPASTPSQWLSDLLSHSAEDPTSSTNVGFVPYIDNSSGKVLGFGFVELQEVGSTFQIRILKKPIVLRNSSTNLIHNQFLTPGEWQDHLSFINSDSGEDFENLLVFGTALIKK